MCWFLGLEVTFRGGVTLSFAVLAPYPTGAEAEQAAAVHVRCTGDPEAPRFAHHRGKEEGPFQAAGGVMGLHSH